MSIALQAISPAADAQAIASSNATAFYNNTHWRHQHGEVPLADIISDTALRTPWTLCSSRDSLRCLKAVDTATGELVAYARWILPSSLVGHEDVWPEARIPEPSTAQWDTFKADYQSTIDPRSGGSRYVNMDMVRPLSRAPGLKDREIRARYPDREFLELDYLAVREGWQRRGIARMLVRTGIEKARELGCHLIIMGFTEDGGGLYRSMSELKYEGETRQSCERWPEGRAEGCECIAAFWVALWEEASS